MFQKTLCKFLQIQIFRNNTKKNFCNIIYITPKQFYKIAYKYAKNIMKYFIIPYGPLLLYREIFDIKFSSRFAIILYNFM